MIAVTLNSLRDLRKLNFDKVQIEKAGGLFKARFAGEANYVFGETPEDAEQKLRSGRLGRGQNKCYTKFDD